MSNTEFKNIENVEKKVKRTEFDFLFIFKFSLFPLFRGESIAFLPHDRTAEAVKEKEEIIYIGNLIELIVVEFTLFILR